MLNPAYPVFEALRLPLKRIKQSSAHAKRLYICTTYTVAWLQRVMAEYNLPTWRQHCAYLLFKMKFLRFQRQKIALDNALCICFAQSARLTL